MLTSSSLHPLPAETNNKINFSSCRKISFHLQDDKTENLHKTSETLYFADGSDFCMLHAFTLESLTNDSDYSDDVTICFIVGLFIHEH